VRTLRFVLFNTLCWVAIVLWGIPILLVAPFGHKYPYRIAINWCQVVSFLAKVVCGLTYRVEGKENFPEQASVMFIKHSSAFETYLQIQEFPRACWVMKKELLYLPFFGWALKAMDAIAIDRSAGSTAVNQVVKQGKDRLNKGIWVTVFPEGTRMPPGETKRYGISGTLLAKEAGRLIVPIAHNAGYHWPRRATGIVPGEVVFVIGKPVDPSGRDLRELNTEIQQWIEAEVARIVSESDSI
jgi:1-acyl-sn-glycerol-3-phosphate acyltransferase